MNKYNGSMINTNLINKLIKDGVLKTPAIIKAFENIDRADFILPKYKDLAYEDEALPILEGQTISQPTTVAFMLELLQPGKGQNILDVGSGSGWTTALLAQIVGFTGKVYGVELKEKLVDFGWKNLKKYNLPWAELKIAEKGNLGYPEKSPYDRILVSASADEYPKELEKQLAEDGKMVIPVQNSIILINKTKSKTYFQEYPGFVFVPLIH